MYYYAKVSPRGFYNETHIVRSNSLERLETEVSKYNNDVNAWAEIIKTTKSLESKWSRDLQEEDLEYSMY